MTGRGGPLNGVTVVELAGIGPGPFAGMMLAEMGADVVRVDRPGPQDVVADFDPSADLLGRGKRSIVLDLKHPDGVRALLTMCAGADVLVEGNRPGVLERLGVGPEVLWDHNPALVVGRMTGWGQAGPLSDRAGHDIDYIAVTGVLGAIGAAEGPPQVPLNVVGDFGGGATYLVAGLLAALLEARTTGRGQVVDAAIVDGTVHLLTAVHALMGSQRWTDARGANLIDGGTPFYAVYETSDGRYMAVGALEPRFYRELVAVLELPVDPAAQHDRATWPALRRHLTVAFLQHTQAEWTARLAGTDACVAPVESLASAVDHPQIAARRSLVRVDGVVQSMPAPRFSAHPIDRPAHPAVAGADDAAVRAQFGLPAVPAKG